MVITESEPTAQEETDEHRDDSRTELPSPLPHCLTRKRSIR